MLDSMTNATLFAPNNFAIRSIPDEIKQSWMSNPEKLKEVLSYHLIQPGVHQTTLANNQLIETGLKGQSLRMNFYQSVLINVKYEFEIEDLNIFNILKSLDAFLQFRTSSSYCPVRFRTSLGTGSLQR